MGHFIKKFLLVLLIPLYMCDVQAGINAVNISLTSYHPGGLNNYNNNNIGMSVEIGNDSDYYIAGFFENSYYRESYYIGKGKRFFDFKYADIGIEYGYISGYDGQHLDFADGTYLDAPDSNVMVAIYIKTSKGIKVNAGSGFVGAQISF